ncbi:MAG TPA: AbrB/MazE/SpoVT family DNA-binding domain-containing protein [Solirubrobacterales bacterium]|nr:AbrB/MazE/SpoVT family DNA-binding domain-containing protein [Solirubrobacterales bacterium]
MPEIKLGRQGRIVIPASIRSELGLREGDVLHARVEGRRLVLETPLSILERLRGELREAAGGRDLVAELLAERRDEAGREV